MKQILFLLLTIAVLTVDTGAFGVPEELEDALPEAAEPYLEDADLSGTDGFLRSLGCLAGQAGEQLNSIVRQRIKGAASMLLVVVLCGVTEGILGGSGSKQPFFSMIKVVRPSFRADNAATAPLVPPPTITTSYCPKTGRSFLSYEIYCTK